MRKLLLFILLFIPSLNFASVFGVVKGIVHDPQHRPIAKARVLLKSATSDWKSEVTTNDAGQFLVPTVPLGDYEVTVESPGFARSKSTITVTAGDAQELHFQLGIAKVKETVNVTGEALAVNPSSSTTETMIGRHEIQIGRASCRERVES